MISCLGFSFVCFMLFYNPNETTIGFLEIPKEISLNIPFTGCPIHCPNCHSKHNWDLENFPKFTKDIFYSLLKKYKNKATTINFLGGDWLQEELLEYLIISHEFFYKTCLYTGQELDKINKNILDNLDYIKTGAYISQLGGLDKETTNQRFYKIVNNKLIDITKEFRRKS